MKICVLGLGTWGFCLAKHLSQQGHDVIGWTKEADVEEALRQNKPHPSLHCSCPHIEIASTLREAISSCDVIVESVTTHGLRSVCQEIAHYFPSLPCDFVITSKGIEQTTCLPPPDICVEIFGASCKDRISLLSGPSFAVEVAAGLPTAVACGSWELKTAQRSAALFHSPLFQVFPCTDIDGMALCGALKNVIAIAVGVADGLNIGMGAKAMIMTLGLQEIMNIAVQQGAQPATMYGLSGLGDLILTCSSETSRNFQFGHLLSCGLSLDQAKKQVGLAIEGAYTCLAAHQIAQKHHLHTPVIEMVFNLITATHSPQQAIQRLMDQSIAPHS